MQLIVRYYSNVGKPIHKIEMNPNCDVIDQQEKLYELTQISPCNQILTHKRDGYTLRLVPGWNQHFYELEHGSVLFQSARIVEDETLSYDGEESMEQKVPKQQYIIGDRSKFINNVQKAQEEKQPYFQHKKKNQLSEIREKTENQENFYLSDSDDNPNEYNNYQMDISRDSSNENTIMFDGQKKDLDGFSTKDNRPQIKDDQYRYLQSLVNSYCSFKTNAKDRFEEKNKPERKDIQNNKDIKKEDTKDIQKTCKQNDLLKEYLQHKENENSNENTNNGKTNMTDSLLRLDNKGWSLQHSVCSFGHEDVASTLLETKLFDINMETGDGWTPLMLTISRNNYDTTKLLLKSGLVAINQVTAQGSAIHITLLDSNRKKFTNLQLGYSANPELEDSQGKKAIEYIDDANVRKEIMEKYEKTKLENDTLNKKPQNVIGTCYKTGLFFRKLKKRFLEINSDQQTLVRYASKSEYPQKPIEVIELKDIQTVTKMVQGAWLQEGYHYFEIFHQKSKQLFATDSSKKTDRWIEYLKNAISFATHYRKHLKDLAMSNNNPDLVDKMSKKNKDIIDLDDEKRLEKLNSDNSQNTKPQNETIPPQLKDNKIIITSANMEKRVFKYKINLNSFDIVRFQGHGAFGRVYKVRLKQTGKFYAMKVLPKEPLIKRNQIRYAKSEAHIQETANHPFILSLHFAFQTPGYLYMVIDYCSGGDLSVQQAQRNNFSEQEAKFYICELVLAIEQLHTMNVLYRDLKPENILIDKNGHIKLADFGLAKEGIGKKEFAKSFCGSPIYQSPDMLNGKGASQSTDIYGIGLVQYEMIMGVTPFFTEDVPKLYKRITSNKQTFPASTETLPHGSDLDNILNNLKSKHSKTYINIEFINKSSDRLTYQWINHRQLRTEKFIQKPGESQQEKTQTSHPWIIYRNEEPISAYNPSSSLKENQRIVITTDTNMKTQVRKQSVSHECEDFLKKILTKDPETRLGAYDKNALKQHPFFAEIEWNKVYVRELKAPFFEDEQIEHFNRRLKLNDNDYTKENFNKMRVKNFTFVRESEVE